MCIIAVLWGLFNGVIVFEINAGLTKKFEEKLFSISFKCIKSDYIHFTENGQETNIVNNHNEHADRFCSTVHRF